MCSKDIIDWFNNDFSIYLLLVIYLLAKININTCIKTEPTTMTDYKYEVNIYVINIIRLLIKVFVKSFIYGVYFFTTSSRNLRDDDDLDGDYGAT